MTNTLKTLAALILAALAGCTAVRAGDFSYTNLGFEKSVGKVSITKNPDGSVTGSVEGVKNTTPAIVEAAVDAAIRAAK